MDEIVTKFLDHVIRGEYHQAITMFDMAIANNPDEIINYWYLGIAYLLIGEIETAEATWMSVLLVKDNWEETRDNLIKTLQKIAQYLLRENRLNLAILIYEKIVDLDEENINNYQILGYIYRDLQDFQKAEYIFKRIIDNQSDNPNIYLEYANLLWKQYRYEEIIKLLEDVLDKFSQEQNIYLMLMLSLTRNGQAKEATLVGEKGLKINPNNLLFQLENARIFPILYETEAEIEFYYQRFSYYLEEIINNLSLDTEIEKQNALKAISLNSNFYLQYQGKNTLDLQVKYGKLVHEIMSINYPEFQSKYKPKKNREGQRIKLGYISSKMFDNVIGELFYGWIKYHDSQEFEINCYYIGPKDDSITKIYKQYSDKFIHIQNNLELICKKIIDDQLDILIFLDLGMSPELTKIAGLKLAPIQGKAWGPPVTSGSPTMNYFLSSDLMESSQGEKHYAEKLIRLPNIAVSYSLPKLPKSIKSRNEFNLPENAVIYWSCQSLFKYLPQYDYIFASIASQVNNSKFLFIQFPLSKYVNNQFKKRLEKAFRFYDLNSENYCIFLPELNQDDFLNINLIADIGLDTFSWSGGKTTMEAIACDLPVVTSPGEFMRGRHSYGILKMIELENTIAYSEKEYIDIAVKLGQDPKYRQNIVNKIKANKHRLFQDLECVKGLEKFLIDVVGKS
jgi:predicted O-linked N-acetylglucosamine transferase (SPINDLY family)